MNVCKEHAQAAGEKLEALLPSSVDVNIFQCTTSAIFGQRTLTNQYTTQNEHRFVMRHLASGLKKSRVSDPNRATKRKQEKKVFF
jgi:hypothetical protein